MKSKFKWVINALYILGVLFFILLGTEFWIPVNNCKLYYQIYANLFLPISIPLIVGFYSYFYYKIMKGALRYGLIILMPTFVLLIEHHSSRYLTDYRINNNLSIVKKGVITKKSHYSISSDITFKYNQGHRKRTLSVIHYDVTKLSINDTILFVYVEKCKYIAKIYKYKPTKSELEKCKNDCYLINGKLIPIDEYNNSKTKYLY